MKPIISHKWQCNGCGVIEIADITISLGIQDCKCGSYLVMIQEGEE